MTFSFKDQPCLCYHVGNFVHFRHIRVVVMWHNIGLCLCTVYNEGVLFSVLIFICHWKRAWNVQPSYSSVLCEECGRTDYNSNYDRRKRCKTFFFHSRMSGGIFLSMTSDTDCAPQHPHHPPKDHLSVLSLCSCIPLSSLPSSKPFKLISSRVIVTQCLSFLFLDMTTFYPGFACQVKILIVFAQAQH